MEKFSNQVVNQMNPFKCNFLGNVDSAYQDEVISLFSKKLEKYSYDDKKLLLVPLNAFDLQTKALNLENAINSFKGDNYRYEPNENEKYCIKLRNLIINNNLSREELIKLKQEIFTIEREREDTDFRYLKHMLMSNLLTHMMIMETLQLYPNILDNKYLASNMEMIKQYYSYLKDSNIEKLVHEATTPLSDLEFLYSYLKMTSCFYAYVLKSSEYISDFLLQEVVNDPMFNQRSGVISFNYMSADTVSHHVCGNFYLEETHDINTINGELIKKNNH
jgi:hypothetical protein